MEETDIDIRNIVILGMVGAGKRTLGNRIFGETIFDEEALLPELREPSCFFKENRSGNTLYRILIVDTGNTQTGKSFVNPTSEIERSFPNEGVHAILFVISNGRYTDESHESYTHAASRLSDQAKQITFLVITNCEQLSEDRRREVVSEFEQDSRCSVLVKSAERGIYTVGFPNISESPPAARETYERTAAKDTESLRCLIENCSIAIPSNSLMIVRNIVILGVVGAGKKTLANQIFGEAIFDEKAMPGLREPGCFFKEKQSGSTLYKILIVDTATSHVGSSKRGFVDPSNEIEGNFRNEGVHAIVFVLSNGRYTDESHESYTRAASRLSDQAKQITFLIITNCEQLPEDKRQEIVSEFEQDPRCSVLVKSAERGIYTVGFPNISESPPAAREIYERTAAKDAESARCLIEGCSIAIPSNSLMMVRNIVILGMVGAGKKTLGNRIFGETIFDEQTMPGMREPGCFFKEKQIGSTLYRILIVDTGASHMGSWKRALVDPTTEIERNFRNEGVHAIFFVLSNGRYTDESHESYTRTASRLNDEAKQITFLVITNCEQLPEDRRLEVVSEFEQDSRCSVLVKSAEKGIYTVGFPNISESPPAAREVYERTAAKDAESIRFLIEYCTISIPSNSLMIAGAETKLGIERQPIRQVAPNRPFWVRVRDGCNFL